ncbi:DUF1287 domain-containing protein [Luteolibacter pohnpeiensis]|uniref:DUF1287 domain-containing protein n=1 Tax=Luteolibacter pohnpeiensis TaxID=454153 RepID=A0A934VVQ6_9BACT|nr:DUF1287 domain-containing protein [Luteolibacter pohnpeiensis]MBK1881749.1 DUF1287 domain-containing protein [Luteolibacter pohnpeiensis]
MRTLFSLLLLLASLQLASALDAIQLVTAARKQVGVTVSYDPAYTTLKYPGGDVPEDRGVCTDVVIRAMRKGLSMDLQELVHEDMLSHFSAYPKNWDLKKPDKNIDHRRVPNLQTWFRRKGYELPKPAEHPDVSLFKPGDIVTCMVAGKLPHIMIVSDQKTADGRPLIIHNIGSGTVEEDRLFDFPLTGHYRLK